MVKELSQIATLFFFTHFLIGCDFSTAETDYADDISIVTSQSRYVMTRNREL